MLKKILPLFLIYSLGVQAQSTSIGVDTMIIGKPGSSAPIKIKSKDGGYLKKDISGSWIYSNDGVLERKLGSGSGSGGSTGTNLITNDSFEDGIGSPWTSSGGTFSQQTYTIGADDDAKFARFIATTSGQYVEQIVSVKTNLGAGCQVDFKKVNVGTAGIFKVQALDVSNAVLAEQTIGVSAWIKTPTVSFPCPAAGPNNLKLRLISLATGTIEFDRGYIGSNQNLVNTFVINDYDLTFYTPTLGVGYGSISNAKFYHSRKGRMLKVIGTFTAGNVTSGTGEISLPSGLTIDVSYFQNTAKNLVGSIRSITNVGGSGQGNGINRLGYDGVDGTKVWLSSASNQDIAGGTFSKTGVASGINNSDTVNVNFEVPIVGWNEVKQQEVAVSNEQASWFIDANIGGATVNLGTTSITSYSPMGDANLDLIINSQKGSATAEIACNGGVASSGLTCSGVAESVGIAFVPVVTGPHEVCFTFGSYGSNTQNLETIFQVIETANTSSTILNEGGQRIPSGSNSGSVFSPNKVCGTFAINDISKKTFRLAYEQSATSVSSSTVVADRSGTEGQRDIHVTVRPLLSQYLRPVLTGDQVTMNGNKNYTFIGFDVSATGVVSNVDNPNLAPVSCVTASGNATCSFPITFAVKPKCHVGIDQSSSAIQYVSRVSSFTNSLTYSTYVASAQANAAVSVSCLIKLQ